MQLSGLWPAINEWETRHRTELRDLLTLLRLHNAANPELRRGDTASLWAARYYFFRRTRDWKIAAINSRGLKVNVLGDELRLNYHIYFYDTTRRGYIYFKFGKDWNLNSIMCTLGAIRLYDEINILPQRDLFSTSSLPVTFEYVNLLLDESHVLTDDQYHAYFYEMTAHVEKTKE